MYNTHTNTTNDGPSPWGTALAGALPLAGYAILVLPEETIYRLLSAVHLDFLFRVFWSDVIRGAPFPLIFYLLLLGGLLSAWSKGFPRWSSPFLGWLLVPLISGMGIFPGLSDAHLRQQGITGIYDPYLQRIWGPFLVTMLLAILLKPSLEPLKALLRAWSMDWTLVSFMLFGLLGFFVGTFFDELPASKELIIFWQALVMAVLVAGALFYMRSSGKAVRSIALLSSTALSLVISSGIYGAYWNGVQKSNLPAPANGYTLFIQGLVFLIVVISILLAPRLIGGWKD